jgi:hypothetical protein
MRQFTFSILFLLSTLLQAQTTWYIDPAGNDGTGDGTAGNPWASLYKATNMIPAVQGAPGDIINVNAGTYNESHQCSLAPNISIEGEGDASLIRCTYAGSTTTHYDGAIYLANGTNTAQHINWIKLDGVTLTCPNGIGVTGRSNVTINNCTIVNFAYVGIMLHGVGTHDNSIFNCIITNSGGCIPAGSGSGHHPNISLSNQTDVLIYNNIITQTARASNSNGEGISGYEPLKGAKIYGNTITCQIRNGTTWTFALEFFKVSGTEIYDNTIIGEVDMGQDVLLSGYAYGLSFHDNIVGPSAPNGTTYNLGLQCEHISEGVIVYNNIFKNLYASIMFEQYNSATYYTDDVEIYNNILYNCGNTGGGGYGIYFHTGDPTLPQYITDVDIYNNTIIGHPSYNPDAGIMLPTGDEVTNIIIRNNIIQGFDVAPIYANQASWGTIDYMWIENNLFYDNGNSNAPLYVHPVSPNHVTYQNNVIDDPDFYDTFDFHINSGSPANNAGFDLTLSATDYDGVTWDDIPAIGAFEFAEIPPDAATVLTTSITDIEETTASGGGEVTDDGGSAVTARGVCWSVSHNPTTADSKTTNGSGLGVFTSSLTGLTGGLTYYVRAYATNGVATAYGSEVNFTSGTSCLCGKLVRFLSKLVRHGSKLVKY